VKFGFIIAYPLRPKTATCLHYRLQIVLFSNMTSDNPQTNHNSTAQKSCLTCEHLLQKYPNSLFIQPQTSHLLSLHAKIRNAETNRQDFVFYADQLLRHLIEFSISKLEFQPKPVTTPTQQIFNGVELKNSLCAVSILRAGESMENSLRSVVRGVSIGKILIQRDESIASKPARFYYSKLPQNIIDTNVLLMDPMLATGNSVMLAIQQLLQVGVKPENITFVNLISVPEGIERILSNYPKIKIVTGMCDSHLNDQKFIVPG